MAYVNSKQFAIIRILQILQEESDFDHPLTQAEIAAHLLDDYGITMERRAIGRNLSLLEESEEFGVVTTPKGSYIDERDFSEAEIRLLIDSVLTSRYISAKYSKDLIEKLSKLSNRYFKSHIKHTYSVDSWSKTENSSVFYNVELIDNAIEEHCMIEFDYNKYKADKKLHLSSHHKASPYLMIVHNQRYFLMGFHEKHKNVFFYRMDHITNIKLLHGEIATPIRKVEGYEGGIDYKRLSSSMPYMFSDKPEHISFYATPSMVDQMIDWFGYDLTIQEVKDESDGRVRVAVKASPTAMKFWALQNIDGIEVTAPKHLRESIKEALSLGIEKYTD